MKNFLRLSFMSAMTFLVSIPAFADDGGGSRGMIALGCGLMLGIGALGGGIGQGRAAAAAAVSVHRQNNEGALPSVLIMTHSHPRETRGGAEIAALTLFEALKGRSGQAWFLGCAGVKSESRLGAPLTQPYGCSVKYQ